MKIGMDEILLINALEKVSRVSPKDCITEEDLISYLVPEKLVGKAIGKKALNVRKLSETLGKKIEIIGYWEKPEKMIQKEMKISFKEAKIKGKKLLFTTDAEGRRKSTSLKGKRIKNFISRNYGLKEIIK